MWLKKWGWLRILVVVSIVLGVFFRFYNLEKKVYWFDETMTSLRVSGHTQKEMIQQVYDGEAIAVSDLLQRYQYPNSEKTLSDTFNALAGNPEHSPLYYLLARFWLQTFGNSIATIRSLSAVISLFAFPCAYWLCWELFGSSAVGWMLVALIAISPFHVLYAQEAREYSLWAVTILLSSAALLRAMRRQNFSSWGFYGVTVALGFYTHPFSGFVSLSYGIYVFVTERWRWSQRLTTYLLASGLGLLLFTPWLVIVVTHWTKFVGNTHSLNINRAGFLPLFWGLNLSRIFIDVNQGISPFSPLHYLSFLLAGYALYYLWRKAPLESWVFVVTLIGVLGMALILPDLIIGGRRSSIPRYTVPCLIGIQIAVAYLIAIKNTSAKPNKPNRSWKYVAIVLGLCGIISCAVSSQVPLWWHKSFATSRYNPKVAEIVNQSDRPLIISDAIPGRILTLSHLLHPDVQLQLLVKPNIPQISPHPNLFLYRPSEELLQGLKQQNLQIKDIHKSWLWRVESRGS